MANRSDLVPGSLLGHQNMQVRGQLVTALCPLGHVLVLAFLFSHYMVDLTQIWGMTGRPRLSTVGVVTYMYNLFTRASIYNNHPSAASLPLSSVLLALLLVLLLVPPREFVALVPVIVASGWGGGGVGGAFRHLLATFVVCAFGT